MLYYFSKISCKRLSGVANILFIALLFFSCSNSEDPSFDTYSLEGEEVGPIDFFGKPTSIISDQGKFVISDEVTKENLHYLDDNFSVIRSIGRYGNGPDEIQFPVTLLPVQPFEENPLRILTGDPVKEVNLKDSNDNLKFVNYHKDNLLTQKIVIVNDSVIWGQGGSDQFKFRAVNTNNGEVLKELPFPRYGDFFKPNILPFVYHGLGHYHPWWDRVVWCHIHLNTIEFYYPDGEFEKEWVFGDRWTEEELNNRYLVFTRSVPVPNGLLVMHLKEGKEITENAAIKSFFYQALNRIKTRILFFNEEGEVKWSLKLDRFLNDFTFDLKNKRIVGLYGESEERNMVVYELPEELHKDIGF